MLEEFTKKISRAKNPEKTAFLGSSIILLQTLSEIVHDSKIQELSSEEKKKHLEKTSNIVVKEFIFSNSLENKKREWPDKQMLWFLNELSDIASDIVSICDQTGKGTNHDSVDLVLQKTKNLWQRFIAIEFSER